MSENKMKLEELESYCGIMMNDLRGSWASNYVTRMEYVRDTLEEIIKHPDVEAQEIEEAKDDIKLIEEEIEDGEFDGRVFRDCAYFYGYFTEEGLTERVIEELKNDMEFPESLENYIK